MGALRNAVRCEEARFELDRLAGDLERWLARRSAADAEQQYATQLGALATTLGARLEVVRAELGAVGDERATGAVYARCRAVEERVVFLRRYLDHFAAKWDQRDTADEAARLTLLAAEEVVWSCWATVFRTLGAPVMPAPLPYFEPEYDPRAHPRADPPRALRADARLAAAVGALPVPLIAIPPVCRERPWWLVHVAHETGHHVQFDAAGGALFGAFRALMDGAGGERWAPWQVEVFADAFAALCTGEAAGWALCEQLRGEDADAATARSGYPALLVRAALMAALAGGDGATAPPASSGLGPALARALEADLQAVAAVAQAIGEAPLAGGHPLPALCGFSERLAAEADRWRRRLLSGPEPPPETTLAAARTTVAGAVAAWREVAQEPDAGRRAELRDGLAGRARAVLARSHPKGRRAAAAEAAPRLDKAQAALRAALAG